MILSGIKNYVQRKLLSGKADVIAAFILIDVGVILAGCAHTTSYDAGSLKTQEISIAEEESQNTTASVTGLYDLDVAALEKVVDGDTLWVVKDGEREKIRLIGIDTPESVHPDQAKNNEYGEMASDYVKTLLADTEYVYLAYDEDRTDRYDRTLAYVWLSDDTSDITNMLNAAILMNGYAVNKEYKPNVKYSSEFETLRNMAEESDAGLWAYDEYETLIYEEENN